MKRYYLFLLLLIGMAGSLQAQLRKIPSEVTEAFKAKFPEAEKVEWKDKLTYFQAQFAIGEDQMSADFSNEGEWQQTEKKISFEELPEEVKDGLNKSKYADWTPGSVTLIEKDEDIRQYKIYVEKSSLIQKKFLFFTPEGRLEREVQSI
jgi:hypothetical protein